MTGKIISRLNRYFFGCQNLLPIAVLRITLVSFLLPRFYSIPKQMSFTDASLTQLHELSPLIEQLRHLLFADWDPSVLTVVYVAAGVLSVVGIFTRISLLIFGTTTLFFTGVRTSLGIYGHDASLTSQALLVLAVIPGTTNLTVDRLLISWVKHLRGQPIDSREALCARKQPVWGVRLLLMLVATVYFTAGASKIRYGGIQWLNGKTLKHYLDGSASPERNGSSRPKYLSTPGVRKSEKWKDGYGLYSYSYGNRQFSHTKRRIGEYLSAYPMVMVGLSLFTILWELSSFLVFFDRFPRTAYLLVAIMMHFSIGLLMNLPFIQFRIICFFLLDWDWIRVQLSSSLKHRLPPRVLHLVRPS